MNGLYEEMKRRFPEIADRLREDAELPYMLMLHLAEWLRKSASIRSDVAKRVVEFARWCEKQPRTEDAGTDIYTILVVGFYEELFGCATTRALLPMLIPRDDLRANAEYLKQWVGEIDYQSALSEYEKTA